MTLGLSQVTLPQNFESELVSQLLMQPEPQYFYAQLVKSAINASLGGDVGSAFNFQAVGAGQPYASATRDRLMLEASPIAQETFAAKVDFTRRKGDLVRLNRPKFTDSTYTLASRRLTAGQTISTEAIAVDSEQSEIKLYRLGGPYGSSAVQPYGIEAFDTQFGLHEAASITKMHLQRDFDKVLDTVCKDLLDDASTTVYPDGMTAVTDAVSAGQFPLTYNQITRIAKSMDEASLPKFSTGRRILNVTPTGKRQLKDDPQFARHADYFKEKNPLFPGWFATCDEFDMFASNTLSETDNASSVEIHYAHAIAPGALGIGMGRAPTVRASTDTNFGETLRVIWLADLGFKLFDNRFVKLAVYSEDEDQS